ncbi:MAG: hypothetical protein HY456_02570 [Parcubacteria group bacterium]|nr:hypothetical protein [Parcubacteria group bacterium]
MTAGTAVRDLVFKDVAVDSFGNASQPFYFIFIIRRFWAQNPYYAAFKPVTPVAASHLAKTRFNILHCVSDSERFLFADPRLAFFSGANAGIFDPASAALVEIPDHLNLSHLVPRSFFEALMII